MYVSSSKALALLRIGFGLYFLSYALDKTMGGWLTSAGPITNFIFGNPNATPPTRGAIPNATPFYADFLTSVVQPSPQLFSQLVVIGEWTAGILLLLGLLTRLGAIVGLLLNLNYIFMKGLPSNGGSIDRLFGLSELIFLLAAAGLVWGLDGMLRQQLAGNAVTRWLAGLNGRAAEEEPRVHAHA
ncbi:MAG: TQO small subunit DoxD [Chloroflexota bacterium]